MNVVPIADRYEVRSVLGEGAMGRVLEVHDLKAGQARALKVIARRAGDSARTVLQFKQEFRLMTQLRHPNCCEVYDYGVDAEGAPYFTMEVVEGHGLDELLPLDEARFSVIFAQVLRALAYVHQAGFVHRDLKSANVRVTPDGVVKLMDYGLMDFAGRAGAPISGTPAYMAPEVVKRGPIDQRTDLYAAGVLAYELLTGRVPFNDGDRPGGLAGVLRAHVEERPKPPSAHQPTITPALERVILKLLAKEPVERYRSAVDVLAALGLDHAVEAGNLLGSTLAGREAELEALEALLPRLTAGKPGEALALTGPPGVGKSRLVDEFRFAVQLGELLYATGGLEERGNAPYAPLVAALRELLPALRAQAPAVLEAHAPVLVKLLPELGVAPAPDLDPPSKEKLRLQSTVAEAIGELARVRPLVLVLEDWHWADPLSREVLPHLVRQAASAPLLVVLTARPEGGAWPAEVREVPLGTLDAAGVRRMVTAMLGTPDVEEVFLDAVTEFSQGNPFAIKELLEHLVENSTLQHEGGRWNTDEALTLAQLPKSLKGLLLRKIAFLPPEAQRVAQRAALVGKAFDMPLLQAIAGLPEDGLFDALEKLQLHQIFMEEEVGFRFAQDQVQELLAERLEGEERRAAHALIATALEARLAGRPLAEAPLPEVAALAHHVIAAGLAERIVPIALEAGIQSARLFANADAERFLKAGLDLVPLQDTQTRFDYLRTLGDVTRMLGHVEESIAAYEAAIPLAEDLGQAERLGHLMTSLAKSHQIHGDLDQAFAGCERSLAACERQGDRLGMARSLLTSCRLHYYRGHQAEALAHTERALGLAREVGDRFRIGEALAFQGYIHVTSGPSHVEAGIRILNESVQLLTQLNDLIGLQNAFNLLGNAQTMQGDFLSARETFQRNQRVCESAGLEDDLIITRLNLAICDLELGGFAAALEHASGAGAAGARNHNAFQTGLALILEATARMYLGQFSGAIAGIDRALGIALEASNKYMETLVMQYKVELYVVLGHLGEAKSAAKALIALIKETGNTEPESRMNAFLGEIVARQGDLDGGEGYLHVALAAAAAARAKGIQARALKARAWIAIQRGEWLEARQTAEEALNLSRGIGARYLETELIGMLGEVSLATRQGDARGYFEAMGSLATDMGSPLLLAQALFGQAAALGAPVLAVPLVQQAQQLLKGLMEGLDEDAQLCFGSLRERGRILDGDFINGFKPRSSDIGIKVSLPGMRFGQSLQGMG